MAKWTIEIREPSSGNYTTYVFRGANDTSTGTAVTVPQGTTQTTRLHEAIIKGVIAALNDRAAGN
jgi:hypothetical protein